MSKESNFSNALGTCWEEDEISVVSWEAGALVVKSMDGPGFKSHLRHWSLTVQPF